MPLKEYNRKRDFKATPEPAGDAPSEKKGESRLKFVIQKHRASRLHFDFRLEVNGVMISWAVPKGPSVSPTEKRLAMHVEDHPLEYRNFEGTIPEGNYGAGTVMIWDEGTYEPIRAESRDEEEKVVSAEYKAGDLKIRLHGKKLHGEFALVQLKGARNKDGKSWLLIKHRDEYADKSILNEDLSVRSGRDLEEIAVNATSRKLIWEDAETEAQVKAEVAQPEVADFPAQVTPMLATLTDEPFQDDNWTYELKLDGYRALAAVQNGKVELYSRNGQSFNKKYELVVNALEKLPGKMLLDGEIVAVDAEGVSKFQYLQNYGKGEDRQLLYYVFDILYFDKFDLRKLPFSERRQILEKVLKTSARIKLNKTYKSGFKLFETAKNLGGEGIIAKRKDSVYETRRSDNWLKIKHLNEQEFVIGGYTHPKGSRKGFGSLLVGEYKGGRLLFRGHVGTGFNDATIEKLKKQLDKHKAKESPFAHSQLIEEKTVAQWIKPELVAQLKFAEWTGDKQLRQAVFMGLREDKKAAEVKVEARVPVPTAFELSNLDKVYWPKDGYKKGDLLAYYEEVGELMLPYLLGRPQNMNRHPSGIDGSSFFQKDFEQSHPDWVITEDIYSESTGEVITYLVCQNKETLLYLANLGCIEINPWNSRVGSLENPDYLIFDLDPSGLDYKIVVEVALTLKKLLDELKVPSYPKTSGKRGFHVYVPLGTKYDFEPVRLFAKLVAMQLQMRLPEIISLERSPDDRKGKVYVDYLQNRKGQTTCSVYSVRPVDGAPVSTPLDWDEVSAELDPKKFTIKTMPKRLAKVGDLWKGLLTKGIDIEKAMRLLENAKT